MLFSLRSSTRERSGAQFSRHRTHNGLDASDGKGTNGEAPNGSCTTGRPSPSCNSQGGQASHKCFSCRPNAGRSPEEALFVGHAIQRARNRLMGLKAGRTHLASRASFENAANFGYRQHWPRQVLFSVLGSIYWKWKKGLVLAFKLGGFTLEDVPLVRSRTCCPDQNNSRPE